MALEFEHIFAGIGMGRGEIKGDALVDLLPSRIEKTGQSGEAGFGDKSNQLTGNRTEISTGKTHNADATATVCGSNGSNQISWPFSYHPRSCA